MFGYLKKAAKNIFSGSKKTDTVSKLTESKIGLEQKRDVIYIEIDKITKQESELLKKGKESESQLSKKILAGQIAQLRKTMSSLNTRAGMINQQIDIISTDLHNQTIIAMKKEMPSYSAETLTENAVAAEEMLEELTANADSLGSVSNIQSYMSQEELDILAEFETPSTETQKASTELDDDDDDDDDDDHPPIKRQYPNWSHKEAKVKS